MQTNESYTKLQDNDPEDSRRKSLVGNIQNSIKSLGNDKATEILVEEDSDSSSDAIPRDSGSPAQLPEAQRKSMSYMEEAMYLDNCRETALKTLKNLCKGFSEDKGQPFSSSSFVQFFGNANVLQQVFKLFDYNCCGYLKQPEVVDLLKRHLNGVPKGLEFAELVETVAYVIAGQDDLTVSLFVSIFTSKGVLSKLFRVIDSDGTGCLSTGKITDFFAQLTHRREVSEITEEEWRNLEQVFRQRMKDDKHIYLEDFKKLIQCKNSFFAERVFEIFDKDGSGSISLNEFKESIQQFCGKTVDDKARFLFQIYDVDGDGCIGLNELKNVMQACMEENGMKFSDEQLEDLTLALFEDANTDKNSGGITYEELKGQLLKHKGLLDNLSITIDRWLKPVKSDIQPKRFLPYHLSFPYLKNNYVFLTFLFCYVGVNIALFVSRAMQFVNEGQNIFFILAKGAGQTLNFNCMFVLVLMLRHCITFLRVNGFASYLPLDHHVYLHKVCGFFIFFFGMLHTIMHCINFPLNVAGRLKSELSVVDWLFTMKPELFGLIPGIANPTGWPLVVILLIMVLCSLPAVRRRGNFEVFYWTHLLYIPFWILVILHGPNFWKWFIGPGIIFAIERIMRIVRKRTKKGRTYVSTGILLPSRVTHLEIKRPPNFYFHPGDYVFVKIPKIAKMEWHPFTISSAPERPDTFSLHIRGVGGWTNNLYSYFEKEQAKLICKEELRETGSACEGCRKLLEPQWGAMKSLGHRLSALGKRESTGITARHSCRRNRSLKKSENHVQHKQKDGVNHGECKISITDTDRNSTVQYSKSFTDGAVVLRDPDPKTKVCLSKSGTESGYRYLRNRPCVISVSVPITNKEQNNKAALIPRISYAPGTERQGTLAVPAAAVSAVADDTGDSEGNLTIPKALEIVIDGPYGAPSSHIFRAEHAVLIAAGIGVTPFASILQSIMHRYWDNKHSCPRCAYTWNSGIPESVMNLRKVDFFWINREQRSFEWFVELLSQLEMEQAEMGGAMERFLDMHMYITSALQRNDMKAVGLQLALDLLHQKEKRDLITGLKTRTNAGRPNWDKVFQQLADQNKGRITVFYCGPPQLAKTLREKCDIFGFDYRKEIF